MTANKNTEYDFFTTNLNANLREKHVPSTTLQKVVKESVKLFPAVISFDFWRVNTLDNGLIVKIGESDGACMSISETSTLVPRPESQHEQMLAMISNPECSVFETGIWQTVDRFVAKGLRPVMATEIEFYLMDEQPETIRRPIPSVLANSLVHCLQNTESYPVEKMDRQLYFIGEPR